MKLTLNYNGQPFPLNLAPTGNAYTVEVDGVRHTVEIIRAQNGRLDIHLSADSSASVRLSASESAPESAFTAHVTTDGPRRWVTIHGRTYLISKAVSNRRAGAHAHHATGQIVAPMPGQVRAVNVSEGDLVTRGQTLLLIEAMKMEIRVQAPADGVVQALRVRQGQTVEREQVLIVIADR